MNRKLPEWLTIRAPRPGQIQDVDSLIQGLHLHTVCQSARCPNLTECWSKHTATFMILGDVCTRSCGFCAISTGRGEEVDPLEPRRVAQAAKHLGLKHVVITSVTRDDLADGGAEQFAATIRAVRHEIPGAIVEVLTPDFKGIRWCIKTVADAQPDIYNHNVETVERLQHVVRPQAKYWRSIDLLYFVKRNYPHIYTKSGLMVGLGETKEEVVQTMRDLRDAGVDCLTIGQYLRPTMNHLPVVEYVHPSVFAEYRRIGEEMGFLFVASAPFVRSSYNAEAFSRKVLAERLAQLEAVQGSVEVR